MAKPLAAAMAAQVPGLLPATTEGGDIDVRVHLDHARTAHVLLSAAAIEAAADGRAADAQTYASLAAQTDLSLGTQLDGGLSSQVGGAIQSRL